MCTCFLNDAKSLTTYYGACFDAIRLFVFILILSTSQPQFITL